MVIIWFIDRFLCPLAATCRFVLSDGTFTQTRVSFMSVITPSMKLRNLVTLATFWFTGDEMILSFRSHCAILPASYTSYSRTETVGLGQVVSHQDNMTAIELPQLLNLHFQLLFGQGIQC